MTYAELKEILIRNRIPEDVVLMSDSGWECCATDMDGIYYNKDKKTIVFRQSFCEYEDRYTSVNGWERLL